MRGLGEVASLFEKLADLLEVQARTFSGCVRTETLALERREPAASSLLDAPKEAQSLTARPRRAPGASVFESRRLAIGQSVADKPGGNNT
jgi:hypothetical protein